MKKDQYIPHEVLSLDMYMKVKNNRYINQNVSWNINHLICINTSH